MTMRVVSPGAFTTIQDLGRPGWASSGVPPSGAMDQPALRAANLLVGNAESTAALEITLNGPLIEFVDAAAVAVVGALFEVELDGEPVFMNETLPVQAGSVLRIGKARAGCRAYLAVRGGIDVPAVLGSRSTYAPGGIGGPRGRALQTHDFLRAGPAASHLAMRRIKPIVGSNPTEAVRAVPGPQENAFTARALEKFWATEFRVSPRSDRAGMRLECEPLAHAGSADLDPEGVVTGAVQVPGDGLPIVLGPDGPATGGYVKIATVITADLPVIAQARPGDTLRFVPVDVERARSAWRDRERALFESIEELE